MELQAYRDELTLRLTGLVLESELSDTALDGCINSAFRQIQRYIDSTKIVTIPYKPCIDLSDYKVSAVARIYRAEGYMLNDNGIEGGSIGDPMYLASWQMMSGTGGGFAQLNTWSQNYAAYNTALQIRNTMSTDLAFRYDKDSNKLYINCPFDNPDQVTVEYIPRFDNVNQITSDFWIDMLMKLSLAICKQVIGRIRKKYRQTNSLLELDVDILQEGIEEEKSITEALSTASQLVYPID
jgi:hypothetical protein